MIGGGLPRQACMNWTYFAFFHVSSCKSRTGFALGKEGGNEAAVSLVIAGRLKVMCHKLALCLRPVRISALL